MLVRKEAHIKGGASQSRQAERTASDDEKSLLLLFFICREINHSKFALKEMPP